jgi:quinol monooxygenase YgiN
MHAVADKAHPQRITIMETYASKTAYDQHIQTAHFQKYKQGTLSMVKSLELTDVVPIIHIIK